MKNANLYIIFTVWFGLVWSCRIVNAYFTFLNSVGVFYHPIKHAYKTHNIFIMLHSFRSPIGLLHNV